MVKYYEEESELDTWMAEYVRTFAFEGGGSKEASEFQCADLPFEY